MSRNIRINRRRSSGAPLIILMLCAIVAFSAVTAGIWQSISPPSEGNFTPILPSDISQSLPSDANSSQSSGSQNSNKQSSHPENSQPQSTTDSSGDVTAFGVAVPESERVRSEYFDDAVFIGDSLTTGITLYDVMSNTTVYASTGINLESVFTKEVVKQGEKMITIFDALKIKKPAKIYVMLGANGIGQMDDSWIIKQYDKLIKELKSRHGDATIYIQSVVPINEELFHQKYNDKLTNAKIDATNNQLLKLAQENGVYYLALDSIFKDASGGLPSSATPDGLHFKSEQYIQWFDYLKTHTVQK